MHRPRTHCALTTTDVPPTGLDVMFIFRSAPVVPTVDIDGNDVGTYVMPAVVVVGIKLEVAV